jgi:hypothetical protein
MFFLWSPLNFEDVCLHYMVHEDATGTPWAQTAAVLPVIGDDDPVFGPGDGVRPLPDIGHRMRWAPGLRRAQSATLVLNHPEEPHQNVELEPLLAFRMKGVGYFHPDWAHGIWHDELAVGGEEATTDELDVLRRDCLHLQQVVRASWGERTGIGVLEQIVFGAYQPAGFTEDLNGAVLEKANPL